MSNCIGGAVPASGSAAARNIGYTVQFGGDAQGGTEGEFYRTAGSTNTAMRPGLDQFTEYAVPVAANLRALGWNTSQGDVTTVLAILRNGLVVDTVTLSGPVGALTLSGVAFAAGDLVALEFDAGTPPRFTMAQVYFD